MPVKVEIRLNAEIMADFMVYHILAGKKGMVAFVLAALNVGFAVAFAVRGESVFTVLFLAIAMVILFGFSKIIRAKTLKQMGSSERLRESVIYEFDDQGVRTTIGKESGKASWGKFVKAISYKNLMILYDPDKQAIIMPIEQLGEQYAAVVEIIRAHMPKDRVRIRI